MSGICEYVTLQAVGDFRDLMKFTYLKLGRLSWIIQVSPIEFLKAQNFILQKQERYNGKGDQRDSKQDKIWF